MGMIKETLNPLISVGGFIKHVKIIILLTRSKVERENAIVWDT